MNQLFHWSLQGMQRRIVYVSLYELIAIVVVSLGLAFTSNQPVDRAVPVSIASSLIAMAWNYIFNQMFERWEARQHVKGRNLRRRIAHALCFEGGLTFALVPLFAWWFGVSLWHAFLMDFGLLLFFLFYTFVFSWVFDRIFGLPASAQQAA